MENKKLCLRWPQSRSVERVVISNLFRVLLELCYWSETPLSKIFGSDLKKDGLYVMLMSSVMCASTVKPVLSIHSKGLANWVAVIQQQCVGKLWYVFWWYILILIFGVPWCCGNYCWLALVLWFEYWSLSFQFFVLHRLVITPVHNTKKLS